MKLKKNIKIRNQQILFGSVAMHTLFMAMNANASILNVETKSYVPQVGNDIEFDSKNSQLKRILNKVKEERFQYISEYGKCHDKSHGKIGPFGKEFGKEAPC